MSSGCSESWINSSYFLLTSSYFFEEFLLRWTKCHQMKFLRHETQQARVEMRWITVLPQWRFSQKERIRWRKGESTDEAGKRRRFYCQICRNDPSVLAHGTYEWLRHFSGAKHFYHDKQLPIETPVSYVLFFFECKPLPKKELEQQRHFVRHREHPLFEERSVYSSGAVNNRCQVLAEVFFLIDVLCLGKNYDLFTNSGLTSLWLHAGYSWIRHAHAMRFWSVFHLFRNMYVSFVVVLLLLSLSVSLQ